MTDALQVTVDAELLKTRFVQAAATFPAVLDRFARRAAGEFARAEKIEAPKGLTTLTNSVQVHQNAMADYKVGPTVNYAAAVNDGGRPHWAPLRPLEDWLRTVKRVTDPWELHDRAKGLQRFIAAHGTKANPFVERTRAKMDDRVVALLREGVHTATQQTFDA